jgi:hypothetical protein
LGAWDHPLRIKDLHEEDLHTTHQLLQHFPSTIDRSKRRANHHGNRGSDTTPTSLSWSLETMDCTQQILRRSASIF